MEALRTGPYPQVCFESAAKMGQTVAQHGGCLNNQALRDAIFASAWAKENIE